MRLALPQSRAASQTLPADPILLWDILTEYSTWAEWLPLVTRSEETARENHFARASFDLAVLPGRPVKVECAHAPNTKVLVKSMIGQAPEFILDWTLAPAGPGQTMVTVRCTWIHTPATFKAGAAALKVERWLGALAAQAESFAGDLNAGPPDPSTIFEVHETDEGLICWFRGKKYEMKAVS